MISLKGTNSYEFPEYFMETLSLLKTVAEVGLVELTDLKPNEPVFVIHQQTSPYPTDARPLVGCRVVAGTTDYVFPAGETYHYFGGYNKSNNNTYYCCELMVFVPSGETMTLDFNTGYPMSESRRCLIFQ